MRHEMTVLWMHSEASLGSIQVRRAINMFCNNIGWSILGSNAFVFIRVALYATSVLVSLTKTINILQHYRLK